jgi:hypothetical protein
MTALIPLLVGHIQVQSKVNVLTPVIRPIKHSEILPAHVHPVKELGQSQVHVWISSIRPIKHATNQKTASLYKEELVNKYK